MKEVGMDVGFLARTTFAFRTDQEIEQAKLKQIERDPSRQADTNTESEIEREKELMRKNGGSMKIKKGQDHSNTHNQSSENHNDSNKKSHVMTKEEMEEKLKKY